MLLPNTKFRFLRQTGGGIVYKQNNNGTYHVQTDEGFFIDVLKSEIVEVATEIIINHKIKPKEHILIHNKPKFSTQKYKNCPVYDLHIHAVNENILQIQMANFRQKLIECKHLKIKTCIFIHGNGDGILRDAIRNELKKSEIILKFEPANAINFGTGATKVFLK